MTKRAQSVDRIFSLLGLGVAVFLAGCLAPAKGAEHPLSQASANGQPAMPRTDEYDHHGIVRRLPENVTFNAHIRPIMSNTCFVCHGPDETKNDSGLRLDSFEAAVETAAAIEPGNSQQSPVWQRLNDVDDPMPPAGFRHQLSDYERALIGQWIDQGAQYQQHWAFCPLQQPLVPDVNHHSERVANPIDAFVLEKLELAGIEPSPPADRATQLRRLSLDLIGLPPTPDELQSFANDTAPDAWEKQVERLLASPHYGERMASPWLDIVRFADTVGFHGDQNQRIFPYRDYVIRSINENQPFDQFTREQLAGDLLENPTSEKLVATGLIRLNMMTREGGEQPEEYLARYTADRVRMIGTAWLGVTTGCCECHNHKYDPLTIRDFYSLGAFFDDVRQWGVYHDYGYTPNPDLRGFSNDHPFPPELRVSSDSLKQQIRYLEDRLDEAASCLVTDNDLLSDEFQNWLRGLTDSVPRYPDMWLPAKPDEVPVAGSEPIRLTDGSLLFAGPPSESAATTVDFVIDQPASVRALRMQVLPDEANGGSVGRAAGGRFAAQLKITNHPSAGVSQQKIRVRPRFIRIELDNQQILSLAEVQVLAATGTGELTNIAAAGTATQSSTEHDGQAGRAIDGNTDGDYHGANSTTHTRQQNRPWWELDLGGEVEIRQVRIWNRTDGNYAERLNGFRLVLLDENRQPVFRQSPARTHPQTTIDIPGEITADELRIPEQIAFVQANRFDPDRYANGQPSRFIEGNWRSGPSPWQLPTNESQLEHLAVYHLERPLKLEPGDRLSIEVISGDIGRIQFAVSPLSRAVVGEPAGNRNLITALQSLAKNPGDLASLSAPETIALRSAWYQHKTPVSRQAHSVQVLRNAVADCHSGLAMTMVSQPIEDGRIPQARVLQRGNWQDKTGERVFPNTPQFLPGYQSKPNRRLTRLDLANWLTSPDNPLTARHYVNRTWKHFFGTGLSGNLDDLGNQGEWPSHPELLDWLAAEFRQTWDRKHITRLIVTSGTYRQQAAVRNDLAEIDPYNRLLSRQSARRLEAEIVRDNALAISGLLLTDWIGGPSVFPPQPEGHYVDLQFPNREYVADTDGRQYRRGLYMHWQRTFLHPMLGNFDAPARDECVADRVSSNSPQQALTLLNDPVFVEAAIAFADRLVAESPQAGFSERMIAAFQLAVARVPAAEELDALQDLYQRQLEYFTAHRDEADSFVQVGQFRPVYTKGESDTVAIAALSQVCRVLLNLHETITRY